MPLADDGDLIRGLGFVALYAAYLEEGIDEVLEVLAAADSGFDQRVRRRSTGQKIEYIRERFRTLEPLPQELAHFPDVLAWISELLEQRHLIIHGRVYNVPGVGDVRRPARHGLPEQVATSRELYALANELFEARTPLNHASTFALPRRIHAAANHRGA
jgi:hypothetical protein